MKKRYNPPMCVYCIHKNLLSFNHTCKAFPDGIPKQIIESEVLHREPFQGDGGIRFEPINPEQTYRQEEQND
jgi:hypothetical protein